MSFATAAYSLYSRLPEGMRDYLPTSGTMDKLPIEIPSHVAKPSACFSLLKEVDSLPPKQRVYRKLYNASILLGCFGLSYVGYIQVIGVVYLLAVQYFDKSYTPPNQPQPRKEERLNQRLLAVVTISLGVIIASGAGPRFCPGIVLVSAADYIFYTFLGFDEPHEDHNKSRGSFMSYFSDQ